jgi:hypothetical protein
MSATRGPQAAVDGTGGILFVNSGLLDVWRRIHARALELARQEEHGGTPDRPDHGEPAQEGVDPDDGS